MKIKNIILCLSAAFMLASCSDFLDIKDESAINPAIWDSENSAKLYLNNLYLSIMPQFGGETPLNSSSLAGLSDETSDMPSMLIGTLGSAGVTVFSADHYRLIRFTNIAINEMMASKMDVNIQNSYYCYFKKNIQNVK